MPFQQRLGLGILECAAAPSQAERVLHGALQPMQVARIHFLGEASDHSQAALAIRSAIRGDARDAVDLNSFHCKQAFKPVSNGDARVLRIREDIKVEHLAPRQQLWHCHRLA